MGKYDDIINLPHHVSATHLPMPMEKRAAQFAPFAALTGHEEAIKETARLTDRFKELSDEEKSIISDKLQYAIRNDNKIEITYFSPDKTKKGGFYKKVKGKIKKLDEYDNSLIMQSGDVIAVTLINEIKIDNYQMPFD